MKEIDTLSFILFLGLLFMFGAAMFLACENARLRTQLAQAKVIVVMPDGKRVQVPYNEFYPTEVPCRK